MSQPHIAACKCLTVIRERLKEHHKAEVDLELKLFISTETFLPGAALPPLNYKYQVSGKKWKKSYVTFNYCPFCGKKNGGPTEEHQ